MRAAALLATALALCGVGGGAQAQQLTLSGRVVDDVGDPAPDVGIRLLAVPTLFEQGLLDLAGTPLPKAVDTVETDDDGRFTVTAPEAGFWRLIAEPADSMPAELTFGRALVLDSMLLPVLELQPTRSVTVEAVAESGAPAAGAWIETWLAAPPTRRMSRLAWRPLLCPVQVSTTGVATLRLPAAVAVEVRAWSVGHQATDERRIDGSSIQLRLAAARARHLTVRDQDGPIAGAVVRVGDVEWPAARTGEDGAAVIHDLKSVLILADGRTAVVEMAEDEGTPGAPFEVVVPEAVTLGGRVVDSLTRHGIDGAFVMLPRSTAHYVRTDPRGNFTLSASGRQLDRVTAAARGHREQTTTVPSDLGELTLVLDPAVDLRGVVLDAAGRPIANAEVVAVPHGGDTRQLRRLFSFPVRRSASDSQGRFVLPRLAGESAYAITARHPGFAPAERIVSDLPAAAAGPALVLSMESGTIVTGKISNPSGATVAGAELRLDRLEDNLAVRYLYSVRVSANAFTFRSRSDADGEFAFADVPVGRFRLKIEAVGFATEMVPGFEIEAGMRTHDLGVLTLEAGVELRGRVVDPDGAPLPGAEVEIGEPERSMDSFDTPPLETTTGADGSFSVADRREGEFLNLDVRLAGYAQASFPGVEVPTDPDFEIVLQPAVTLRGRVVDPQGSPVPGAEIEVAREGGATSFGGRVFSRPLAAARADDDGRFEVVDIEPATVRVTARAEGRLPKAVGGIELLAGVEPDELELELEPGATIEGRVIGPNGLPAAGATVRLEDAAGFSRFDLARADGEGRYRLGGVEPGDRMAEASTEDGLRQSREIRVEVGDNILDFYLEAGVTVSGTVLDSESRPIAEAAVMLSSSGGMGMLAAPRLTQSDATGAFELENVHPGVFRVGAEHPGYAAAELEQPLEVGLQPIAGLLLRLENGAEVRGALVGVEPKDLVSMQVMAVRQPMSHKEGRVESDATYSIGNLSAGLWNVIARSASGRQTQESIEIGPGERVVTLDLDFDDGVALAGRVLRQGTPLSGAWVSIEGIDSSKVAWGETDYDGRFHLEGLEKGRYTVQVSHFGSGTSHTEEIELLSDDEILLELDSGGVSGQVTLARGGSPLAGASVILESRAESETPIQGKGTTTDDEGNFHLADVSPGHYDLRASKAGYAAQSRTLRIEDAAELEGVEFALARVEGLTLSLRLPSGAVPSSVSYSVLDLSDQVFLNGSASVTSAGRVRLSTIPDGQWRLLLKASGTAVRSLRAQAPQEDLAVELQQAARLHVRVEELADDSSAVATLRIRGDDGLPFKSLGWGGGTEDSWRLFGGEVTLDALPPGRWFLSITATDGSDWQRSVTLATGVNDTVVFE